jgi:hypothetical protein
MSLFYVLSFFKKGDAIQGGTLLKEIRYFRLKKMVKKGLDFFYFEILRAPSEVPANLPGQFSHSGQICLHWAAATILWVKLILRKFSKIFFSMFSFALGPVFCPYVVEAKKMSSDLCQTCFLFINSI